MDELDDAGTYFDLGPRKITNSGVFYYMSTRNNNFSNRDQKAQIISYENEFFNDYIGWNGGWIDFRVGQVYIPEGALENIENFRVDIKSKEQVKGLDLDIKVLEPNQFNENTMGSDLIAFSKIQGEFKKPLSVKLKLKRSISGMETYNLYRINNQLLTKIESKIKDDIVEFDTQQSGFYVVKYEKSYGVLIGVLVFACISQTK